MKKDENFKKEIWILLKVFYGKESVETKTLSKEELEIIEKFGRQGNNHRLISFSRGKVSVGLTSFGRECLADFISKASYLCQ